MKPVTLPIPVDDDIDATVRQGAEAVGLKLADVMRQGLRHGVPAFIARLRIVSAERPPRCLDYLDDYPRARVRAKGYKAALREKLAAKHARAHR
jgi:hypothetical protein